MFVYAMHYHQDQNRKKKRGGKTEHNGEASEIIINNVVGIKWKGDFYPEHLFVLSLLILS